MTRKLRQVSLLLAVGPLVGGWGWLGKYGSKFEAEAACRKWAEAGSTREVEYEEFRERLKDKHYALPDYLKPPGPKIPGKWSIWRDVKTSPYEPVETPGMEFEKRKGSFTVKTRSCILEYDTRQYLGREEREVKKRFKY